MTLADNGILIVGIVLLAISAVILAWSVPRHGKTARFVGTQLEPYVTVLIVAAFFFGVLLVVAEMTTLLDDAM